MSKGKSYCECCGKEVSKISIHCHKCSIYFHKLNCQCVTCKPIRIGINSSQYGVSRPDLAERNKKHITYGHKGKKHSAATKLILSIKAKERFKDKTNHPSFGKKSTEETRKKQSLAKGGTGIPYEHLEYNILFSKKLKLEIRTRDNFLCQYCGIREDIHKQIYKQALAIHHIDYNKKNCNDSNLITLCKICNNKANTNRHFWEVFYEFLQNFKTIVL